MHSRHPFGGIVFLRVHGVPQQVKLFLVGSHFTDGTFDGTCNRGHDGERWGFVVSDGHAAFLSETVETGASALRGV